MTTVHLAGCGLASALGPDLPSAVAALRQGGAPRVVPRESSPGQTWPYYAIAETGGDWMERTLRITRRVAEESGALRTRTGALFVASSSIDVGWREQRPELRGDLQDFAEALARGINWRGPVFGINTACTSALNAVQSAAALIRSGHIDHALVLGAELSNRFTLVGFAAMQLLAPEAARPMGAERQGLVLGEALAALYLSRQPSRWRVAGAANVVDGRFPAGAAPGAVDAMCRTVLARSGLQASQIGLVKLQAAGSPSNDATELDGLRQVFDPLPPLVSLKALIGHTMGAAGAAEIALLTACIASGAWPLPNYALDESLGATLARAAPLDARYVLASILGFGGGHAAVVLEDRQAA